jgi:pimeloyl-ACP methyl ester carboxylesterase
MRLFIVFILFAFSKCSFSQAVMLDTARSNFMRVGDVKIHYKVWGKGEPVVLLHGAMEYWKEWKNQIPELAKKYKVIAIDTRGHGESSFTDVPLSYDLFAEDVLAVLNKAQIDSANVIGFGDGGITAMKLAMKYPMLVRKIIAIGSNCSPDSTAVYPEILQKVKAWDIDKMAFYLQMKFKENPNPKMLTALAKRMQTLLLNEPNLKADDLDAIKCPVLFMVGDHDLIKISHTEFMYENVPIGFLSVIAGATHYCIKEKPVVVNAVIRDFIQWPATKLKRF